MKKVACAVLIFTMIIFLINPLSSNARGGFGGGSHGGGGYGGSSHGGGGHWGGGYWGWWAPWAVIGGAAVLAPYYYSPYYDSYYNSPYYEPQPVVIREQPPVYAQPAPSVPSSSAGRIFVYPRQGQSKELQAKDRYECHSWAVSQTYYDPTQPTSGMPEAQLNQMRADYQRAMGACLDGRGYTMK
jgi:hypothetical protein